MKCVGSQKFINYGYSLNKGPKIGYLCTCPGPQRTESCSSESPNETFWVVALTVTNLLG